MELTAALAWPSANPQATDDSPGPSDLPDPASGCCLRKTRLIWQLRGNAAGYYSVVTD